MTDQVQVTQGLAAEYGPHGIRVNLICLLRSATGLLEMFSGTADTPEEESRYLPSHKAMEEVTLASLDIQLPSLFMYVLSKWRVGYRQYMCLPKSVVIPLACL